jgi:tellurite resistance protein
VIQPDALNPAPDSVSARWAADGGRSRTQLSWLLRMPISFFSIPFGIAGLAYTWRLMADSYDSPPAVADTLFVIAALVWLVIGIGWVRRLVRAPRLVVGELRDPVTSPFGALPFIVGIMLAVGLQPYADGAAKVMFVVFLVLLALFDGWVVGEWIGGELDQRRFHPGYLLPTAGGGFIAAQAAADFGWRGLGWACFGIGLASWLMFGSLTLNRLMFLRRLPDDLLPMVAIELAPPAVGGNAYLVLHGDIPDAFLYGLAGYGVLMVLVQLHLLPRYCRIAFVPTCWAFTFCWTALVSFGVRWLLIEHPRGEQTYAAIGVGAVSLLVAAIAARSVIELVRGRFLPAVDIVAGITSPARP